MVNLENYEEYLLMEADGELNETEQKALYAFLEKHPGLEKELELYKAVHFLPEAEVVYKEKEKLTKSAVGTKVFNLHRRRMYVTAAAAAVFIFMFTGIYYYNQNTPHDVLAGNSAILTPGKKELKHTPAPAEEVLHSQPGSPITFKRKQPTYSVPSRQKTLNQNMKPQEPAIADIATVKETNKLPELQLPDRVPETFEQEIQMTPDTMIIAAETPQVLIDNNTITDADKKSQWDRIKQQRLLGFNDLSETLTNKVEQVQDIKDKLKNSEITFKLGKKELFIVRL